MPTEMVPLTSWDHPGDDSFVEFTPEREAFVETSSPGVVGGVLVLKVYKDEDYPDQVFIGGLHTHDRFMPRFGYFETRATFRDVTGFGHWPAFWVHYFYKDRYIQGTEIDIFEYIAAENRIYQTIHWHTPGEHYRSSENFVLEDLDEYHVFGLEWTPDELIFFVNGEVTKHLKKSDNERYVPNTYQMVFFSMSAGVWGGNVADPSNELPASSRFDYCRVYQRPGDYSYYYYPENGPDNNRRRVHIKAENRRTLY